jgi:hypothetical protein
MSKHSLVPNEYKGTEAKLVEQISQASETRFSLTKEYTRNKLTSDALVLLQTRRLFLVIYRWHNKTTYFTCQMGWLPFLPMFVVIGF